MPKKVTTAAGDGTGITVPVGSDDYDIAVDLETMAAETLAVINAKSGSVAAAAHSHTQYAEKAHSHTRAECGYSLGVKTGVTVPASTAEYRVTIPHGLGKTPAAVFAHPRKETGQLSVIVAVDTYDAVNVIVVCRNINTASEMVDVQVLALA
jgi:hypothetical protein